MQLIGNYKIKNESLRNIAETLSDNHYNPDWKNNDSSGDWRVGIYDKWLGSDFGSKSCEAIIVPNHNGFCDEVMECFENECDKPKDIDYIKSRYTNIIFVKPRYSNLTESDIEKLRSVNLGD